MKEFVEECLAAGENAVLIYLDLNCVLIRPVAPISEKDSKISNAPKKL